jgi:hypothetical protein
MERFRLQSNNSDAELALQKMIDLLKLLPEGRRDRFRCLLSIAHFYAENKVSYRNLDLSLRYLAEAVEDRHRDVRSRFHGSVRVIEAIEACRTDIATIQGCTRTNLVEVYASLTAMLPHIAYFGLTLPSRLESLSVGQSIATVGASHALCISQPERALEILEQGRATFWTHTLRLRSALNLVPDELRYRLGDLARMLETNGDIDPASPDQAILEKAANRRRQHVEDFHSLLGQIRAIPGLERFMLHNTFSTLAKAADDGPVVVIVPSSLESHALIIKPAVHPVVVPLPLLTDASLEDMSKQWYLGLAQARSALKTRLHLVKIPLSGVTRTLLVDNNVILQELWTKIVDPVFTALNLQVSPSTYYASVSP